MLGRTTLKSFLYLSRNNTLKVVLSTPKFNFSKTKLDSGVLDDIVNFQFVNKNGEFAQVKAKVGQNLLEIAHANDIDLEGACDMSLACSTCHVILDDAIFQGIDAPTMEEEDLLDLAYGLTDTSRLGCQVNVTKQFEGTKVTLPKATRNFYVDGHKPKPH